MTSLIRSRATTTNPPRSNILNNVRVVLEDGRHIFGEVQCHHKAILEYNEKSHAHDHYGELKSTSNETRPDL